jgi:Domain of unknown function (DUF4288)
MRLQRDARSRAPLRLVVSDKRMNRIKNNNRWYLAGILERCEPVGNDKRNPKRRGTTWLNHMLIEASSPKHALNKALKLGKSSTRRYKAISGQTLQWKFLGLAELLPIYEDIEDGAELMWTDLGNISANKAEKYIKTHKNKSNH